MGELLLALRLELWSAIDHADHSVGFLKVIAGLVVSPVVSRGTIVPLSVWRASVAPGEGSLEPVALSRRVLVFVVRALLIEHALEVLWSYPASGPVQGGDHVSLALLLARLAVIASMIVVSFFVVAAVAFASRLVLFFPATSNLAELFSFRDLGVRPRASDPEHVIDSRGWLPSPLMDQSSIGDAALES
jgi:hypothetical protein